MVSYKTRSALEDRETADFRGIEAGRHDVREKVTGIFEPGVGKS